MEALLFAHSFLRYIVLILLIAATVKAFIAWFGNKPAVLLDRKLATWTVMSVHIELLIGLVLYIMKVKDYVKTPDGHYTDLARFFKFEHISMMILAAILITIGSVTAKKAKTEAGKHKKIAIFFFIGLIIILASIPWPFREALGKGWL